MKRFLDGEKEMDPSLVLISRDGINQCKKREGRKSDLPVMRTKVFIFYGVGSEAVPNEWCWNVFRWDGEDVLMPGNEDFRVKALQDLQKLLVRSLWLYWWQTPLSREGLSTVTAHLWLQTLALGLGTPKQPVPAIPAHGTSRWQSNGMRQTWWFIASPDDVEQPS